MIDRTMYLPINRIVNKLISGINSAYKYGFFKKLNHLTSDNCNTAKTPTYPAISSTKAILRHLLAQVVIFLPMSESDKCIENCSVSLDKMVPFNTPVFGSVV